MKKNLLLLFTLLFSLQVFGQSELIVKVPQSALNVTSARGPNGISSHTVFRGVMILTASELADIPTGTPLTQMSFVYASGTNLPANGTLTVYMENTPDVVNNKSNVWATAITPMTSVYSDVYAIPEGVGIAAEAPFLLSTPFTYQGGGLYVAYEYTGTAFGTSSALYAANGDLPAGMLTGTSANTTPPAILSSTSANRPQLKLGFTNINANDIKVSAVKLGRSVENKYFYPGNGIKALILNQSNVDRTNVDVTLTVTGANPYTVMQTVPLIEAGVEVAVEFTGLPTAVSGVQTVTASVPADDNNTNNSKSVSQTVDCNALRYYETITVPSQASYGAQSGIVAAKFMAPAADVPVLIKGVKVQLSTDINALGNTVYGVVTNSDGLVLDRSPDLVIGNADLGTVKTFEFTAPTQLAPGEEFFIGLAMIVNGGPYLPINTYGDVNVEKQMLYGFELTVPTVIIPVGNMGIPAIEGIVEGVPVTLTASVTEICPGEPITLTAASGLAYPIYDFTSDNVSQQSSVAATYTYTPAASASLQVLGQYNGCSTPSNAIALTVKTSPTVDPITGGTSICGTATEQLATTTTGGTWSSSDNAIATVDASGLVTGVSAGTVTITYSLTANGCTGTATHNITINSPGTLSPITGAGDLCFGSTTTLATASSTGTWSTSDAAVATVSSTGLVTPVSAGQTVTISYTVSDGSGCTGTVTHDINIYALPVLPAITGGSSVCTGASITLSNTTAGGIWSTADGSIATVNSSTGEVTGVAGPGNTTITYTYTDANSCSAATTHSVGVNASPAVAVTLGADEVCVNGAITLTNATAGGTWSSSNTAIALVSTSGVVTGVADGFVVIRYTVANGSGCEATAGHPVDVHALPFVTAVTGPDEVCVGENITLANTTTGGAWMSSDAAVATVGTTGTVTGVAAGNAAIVYEVTDVHGCKNSEELPITVNAAVNLAAITGADEVCVNSTITLANTTTGGVWSSSNTAIATVDNNTGVVTGVTAGTATITYTVTNASGCADSETLDVTVNALPSAGTISGGAAVCEGATITLANTTTGGVWSSSNTTVATVAGGVVTGVTNGTAVITYTVTSAKGCSNATDQAITVNTTPTVDPITGSGDVCEGATISLANATSGGVWATSDAAIATVNTSGVVTGVSAGTVNITYTVTAGSCSNFATQAVIVNTKPSAGTISGTNTVCEGSSVTLTNTVTGGAWSSNNTAVATVAGGVVTGVANGTAVITYTVTNGAGCSDEATFNITVNAMPSAGTISGGTAVCEGSTLTLSSTATGGVWSTSDAAIATVSSTGEVSGVVAGAVTITYTVTTGGCSDVVSQLVTVNAKPSAGTISGTNTVCEGSSVTLTNTVTGGAWSSNNTAVATVAGGVVTGVANGTAVITYTVTNGVGCSDEATFNITVNAMPSAGTISGGTAVCEGSTLTLSSTATGGVWSTSDAAIATVSSTGEVSGVVAGAVTITYTVTTGGCSDAVSQLVTVNALPSAGTISGGTAVCEGSTLTLSSTTTGGVWSTGDAAIATVSSTGVVSGLSAGTTTITYTVTTGSCSDAVNQSITVNATPSAGTISGGGAVCEGSTLALSSTATGGVWSTGDASIATVSSTGIVSGLSAGTVTITYTVTTGSCSDAVSQLVTVNAAPSAGTISGGGAVCEGSTLALSSTATGGVWSTGDASIATVSNTGVVSGLSAGTVTITYTVTTGSCSDAVSQLVTVNAAPSAGTISGGGAVCEGSTLGLSSTATGGVWSTGDASIATVSNTGVVNGLSAGTVTITYTVTTGSCSDAVNQLVTVNAKPSAGIITGTSTVCEGSTVTLSNTVTGGVWSTSDASIATVSGTGVVSGLSAGTVSITYTVTTGSCSDAVSQLVTVNAAPSAGTISGGGAVCEGGTLGLSSTATGGVWSTGDASIATVSSTGIVSGLSAGTVSITYTVTTGSCSDAVSQSVTVNAQPSAGIITGANAVCAGSTVTLSNTTTGGVWSSSTPTVATISSTGVVSGLSAGTTTITYTVTTGSCSDAVSQSVTVNAQPSTGIITGANAVCAGSTVTLNNTTTGGAWSSSNPAVATISSTGVVSGLSVGTTTITYTVTTGSCSDAVSQSVTVNAQPSAGIITGANAVCAGSTVTLNNTTTGGAWSSSNPAVATVSSTGIVSGLSAGTTTITYTVTTGSCSDAVSQSVTVNAQPSAGIITGANTVCAGNTVTLNNTTTGGVWSSSNPTVATISSTGVVSGLSAGTTTITYTVTTGSCSDAVSQSVTVNAQPSAGTITGANAVCAGSTVTLNNTTTDGVWSSSNPTVATVSSTGIVSGLSAGTTTITYTVTTGSCSDAVNQSVTVNAQPSAGIITGANAVCAGSTVTLNNTTTGGVWSSSNPAVATISSTGVVSGLSAGTTTITYTVTTGSCSDAVNQLVTVNAKPSAGTITGTNTVCAGSTVTLNNTTTGGVWSSSNPTVATISSTGVVSGLSAGTTTITYTVTTGSCSDAVTFTITVNAQPVLSAISGGNSLCEDATLTLSNTVPGGTWATSNAAVATVDNNGLVTGIAPGNATITYGVNNNGCTATVNKAISVTATPVVNAISGSNMLCEGNDINLANTTAGGVWSSSNTSIATISNTGTVTGVTSGSVTITYTVTTGGGCSASVTHAVTVNARPANLTLSGSTGVCINGILTLTPSITGGVWSSSNPAVAAVTGGVVSGVTTGTATITYTVTNAGGCSASESRVITVHDLPVVSAISGGNTVCAGSSVTLSATPAGGVWSSSDINKAYVSTAGVLNGVEAGSATIRYTVVNAQGCSNTVELLVAVSGLPAVTPVTGNNVLCAGTTSQLSHAVTGGVWSSDNSAIATVSNGGLVTGVAAGTASIHYTITNAGGCQAVATYTVTVNGLLQVNITNIDSVCLSQSKVTLTSNLAGGTWSGEGVSGNEWTFGDLGAGISTISYVYTNANGCTSIATKNIRRVNCIDTRPGLLASLDLYPNPALDWIRLKLDVESGAGKWTIELRSVTGARSFVLETELPLGKSERKIDISKLPQGMYFITIRHGETAKTLQFVKGR